MTHHQRQRILSQYRFGCRVSFWSGVLLTVLALFLVHFARADYAQDRWSGTVTNPKPDNQRKRVSVFDAVVTEGVSFQQWIPTVSRTGNSTSTHYTQYRIYVDGILVHTSSGLINPAGAGASWSGVAPYVGPTQTKSGVFSSRSMEYRIWSTALGNAWGGWNTLGAGEIGSATTEYTEGTMERGPLVHQWEFEMPPYSSTGLNLEHTGPFFVIIEDYKAYLTPDGGEAYGYDEVDEFTSTEETIVDAATTAPEPENVVNAPDVEYTAGETATPSPRVESVTELEHLDANDEARHSATKGILEQIRKAVADSVSTLASIAGGTPGPEGAAEAAEEEAVTEREDSTREAIEGIMDEGSSLADNVAALYHRVNVVNASQAPEFYLSMAIPWAPGKNLVLESNPTMDAWVAIGRQLIMAYAFFIAVCETVVIVRKCFV